MLVSIEYHSIFIPRQSDAEALEFLFIAREYLVQRISVLRRQLKFPDHFKEAGILEREFKAELKGFVKKAYTFPPTLSNPRRPDMVELESLFLACYTGDYARVM